MPRILLSFSFIASAALAEPVDDVDLPVGVGAPALDPPPVPLRRDAGPFAVTQSIDSDRTLGQQLLRSHRGENDEELQHLADTGSIPVVVGGFQRACRLSEGMHNFLQALANSGKRHRIGLVYGPHYSAHADYALLASPTLTAAECVNHAVDIYKWNGMQITIDNGVDATTAIVDVIDTLPPGQYELGLPRNPYPNDWSDAAALDAQYNAYGKPSGYMPLNYLFAPPAPGQRAGRLLPDVDVNDYLQWYPYTANGVAPCQPSGNACRGVEGQLDQIANPDFRARIQAAVHRARARGVTITGTYADALNHLHLMVKSASPSVQRNVAGDLDDDGKADLLFRNLVSGETVAWLVNGATKREDLTMLPNTSGTWQVVGMADFDGDKKSDVFLYDLVAGTKRVWIMSGGGTVSRVVDQPSMGDDRTWMALGVGDFDGNGKAEILWRNAVTSQVGIWSHEGNAVGGGLPQVGPEWVMGGVGDFNRDGTADIVWHNVVTGEIDVWLMSGGSKRDDLPLSSTTPGDLAWRIKAVGDYDGDGDVDLYWHNAETGEHGVRFLDDAGATVIWQSYSVWVPTLQNNWAPAGAL